MTMTFYVFIGLIVILFGYWLLITLVGNVTSVSQEQVIEANEAGWTSLTLINVLRTPVQVDLDRDGVKEDMETIDLYSYYQNVLNEYEKSGGGAWNSADVVYFKNLIEQETKDAFKDIYNRRWNVHLDYGVKKGSVSEPYGDIDVSEHRILSSADIVESSVFFPGPSGGLINVTLSVESGELFKLRLRSP